MNNLLKFTLLFLGLLMAQVLIFNHIFLFGVALPIIFIYVILSAPLSLNRDILLSLSFLMGFLVDVCSDTLGVNALACTIIAMLKHPILFAYVQHDDSTRILAPSVYSMNFGAYLKYLLTFVAIYSLLYFSIEYFSLGNVKEVIIMAASSTLLSFLLILGLDSIINNRREKRL